MPRTVGEWLDGPLCVTPDRLILATSPGLLASLLPFLPGAQPLFDLGSLNAVLEHVGTAAYRLVSIGFGDIIPATMLNACRAGAVNFHPAPPDYPGSAANHLALYEEASMFGVTAHVMTPAVDTGPILDVQHFAIPSDIGHRSLDELTLQALLSQVRRLAPCLMGAAPWPAPPGLSWRGPARRRADVLALACIPADTTPAEARRRLRAFRDGPDSILSIWQDGRFTSYPVGGRIRGWVDGIIDGAVRGWALDPGQPPVRVRVEVDGNPFADLTADEHRADVAAAGHGDGYCGFSLRLATLPAGAQRVDFLLPTDEWARVPGGPITLPRPR